VDVGRVGGWEAGKRVGGRQMKGEQIMSNKSNAQPQESKYRWLLALIITIVSITGIGVVTALVVIFATDKKVATQMVLTAVLPLLAAWVGTVLAYYYSSESLEAATRSVKALVTPEEKLKAISVTEVMISLHEIIYFTYSDDLKAQDILEKLKASGKGNRLPFLGDKKQPIYMLHKSAIDNALVERALAGENVAELTLKELFEKVSGLKELAQQSFGVIGEDATLADAQSEMRRIGNCQDVFVTKNGRKDSSIVGWITNGIIEENSRV
jgi:hypothetical protein